MTGESYVFRASLSSCQKLRSAPQGTIALTWASFNTLHTSSLTFFLGLPTHPPRMPSHTSVLPPRSSEELEGPSTSTSSSQYGTFGPGRMATAEKKLDDNIDGGSIASPTGKDLDDDFIGGIRDTTGLTLFEKKCMVVNAEIDRQGMGRYQWCIFGLCGFGYLLDLMWAQAFGLILSPLEQEFGFPSTKHTT